MNFLGLEQTCGGYSSWFVTLPVVTCDTLPVTWRVPRSEEIL